MKQVRRLILMMVSLLVSFPIWAASRELKGTVTDAAGEPLVGVSVMLDKSKTGCMTDLDGNFSMQVPEGNVSVKFMYVGYVPQTMKVSANQNNLQIKMHEDAQTLEETVVIGYGTQKKVNLTGAVASLDGKKLEDRPAANITNMLQGTVAGLNVTTNSGLPGSSATLNIRGQASINGGSPLVLIDGSIGEIDNVNPNDVASISVIKDASAAAVYGARAAFGVILVTTKNGAETESKATVRYNGRFGWQEPTTSKDYETTGYWSVYLNNKFYSATNNKPYLNYDNDDMMELLARVNDKTENPDRPWVIEEDDPTGKSPTGRRWKYYCNTDWYHELYKDKYFQQQHNLSLSGGFKKIRYFLSGGLNVNDGFIRPNSDQFKKYNLRAKIDFPVNKWITVGNNMSFYGSTYEYQGFVESAIQNSSRHGLACFPTTNPDGSYIYYTPYITTGEQYAVLNGRYETFALGHHPGIERKTDFTNTTRVNYTPIKQLTFSGDFTYRFNQERNTNRRAELPYRRYPGAEMEYRATGVGEDGLQENIKTYNYYAVNGLVTYKDSYADAHNLTVVAGYNYETRNYKRVFVHGKGLISDELNDLNLISSTEGCEIEGGQNQYALQGIFGRVNYDYMGKYLVELSGRYDGSSRFAKGHRWGFFPSGSLGWRFSEEKFFEPLQPWWSNGKIRFSYGTLGNQNVSDYYTFIRSIGTNNMTYSFGETDGIGKYATLGSPIASDLSWETTHQYDLGFDFGFFNNRLDATIDLYIRDTKDMLAPGIALPAVYGATSPKMNVADLRTKGFELAINWNDAFTLAGNKFSYGVGFNISDYKSTITKYDNPNKTFAKDYYVGMELGELWLYETDGFFKTDEEAQEYTSRIAHTADNINKYIGSGWQAGDLKFVDRNGDGEIGVGKNTADEPGDRYKYGNQLPHLQYGFRANISYFGFDVSAFFQGTGNHYQYPNGYMYDFWGCYSQSFLTFIPKDFKDKIWSEENPDSYFPRTMGYQSSGGYLRPTYANDRYVQNLRYLRFKNLTVGYTFPEKWTKKAYIQKLRIYFTGENLCYWSPLKKNTKYVDPESMGTHSSDANNAFYPWSKSFMFGIDLTF